MGLIDEADRARLVEFGTTIRSHFAEPIPGSISKEGVAFTVTFDETVTFDHLMIEEAIEHGQRVRQHRVIDPASGTTLVDGVHTIGSQRVHVFSRINTNTVLIEVDDERAELSSVNVFLTGIETVPTLESQPEFDTGKIVPAHVG